MPNQVSKIDRLFAKIKEYNAVDWIGNQGVGDKMKRISTDDFNIPTLKDLAEEAIVIFEAEEDLYDDPFIPEPSHDEVDLIRVLYGHNHCDWFAVALSIVKDWEIVAVGEPNNPSIHRLVRDPEGRLIDVFGYVTIDDLKQRYAKNNLVVFDVNDVNSISGMKDDFLPNIFAAMIYLECEPFSGMKKELENWVKRALLRK